MFFYYFYVDLCLLCVYWLFYCKLLVFVYWLFVFFFGSDVLFKENEFYFSCLLSCVVIEVVIGDLMLNLVLYFSCCVVVFI